MLEIINTKLEMLMSAEDDLNAAVAALTTVVSAVVTDIQTLTAELAAAGGTSDPAVEAAVAKLNDLATTLTTAITPPAPAPEPAPSA